MVLAGAISGGAMGGGGVAVNTAVQKIGDEAAFREKLVQAGIHDPDKVQGMIQSGLDSGADTDAYKLAVKLKEKVEKGKAPSTKELADLLRANFKVMEQQTDAQDDLSMEHVSMEDYANNESPVWRNVDYGDEQTKAAITQEKHAQMVSSGTVVTVTKDIMKAVERSYPDLRNMKKKDRTPILKAAIGALKSNLRQFLAGISGQNFEFEVNGKILDAKLYNTGINEVLEKVTRDKANMLYSTEQVFHNAQYLYSTTDYSGDPNVYRWNYFYTPVQIGEDVVGVRIAVRDVVQGQNHTPESQIYNWGIKKDAPLGGAQPAVSDSSRVASSDASGDSIHQTPPEVNPGETGSGEMDPLEGLREFARQQLESGEFDQQTYDDFMASLEAAEQEQTSEPEESLAAKIRRNENKEEAKHGQQQQNHPAAAEGDRVSDGSGGRDAGAGTGRQAGRLAEGTAGRKAAAARQKAKLDRQNLRRHLSPVSSLELGLEDGTEQKNVYVIPREQQDAELRELAQYIEKETGCEAVLVLGGLQVKTKRGTARARGAWTGERVIVQVDHPKVDMWQVADHEIYHTKQHEDPGLHWTVRQSIIGRYSEEELAKALDRYVTNLQGTYSLEGLYGEEYEDAVRRIEEELFADAYAGIDAFGAHGEQFQEAVRQTVQSRKTPARGQTQENGTRQTNAPPEQKFSYDLNDQAIQAIQQIGRKSVNSFSASDIAATERFAQQYWQEMGVKSPFFRAWFGDWRANDQTPVQIASQAGDTRGVQRNVDTGWDIQVSGQVFNETKSHNAKANREAITFLPVINDIVKKAILLDSYGQDVDKIKSPNSLLIHSLYAVADIGNGSEVLKLYVEEMNDPAAKNTKKRAYQLQNIEKAFNASVRVQGNAPSSLTNTSNAIRTVADLFAAVKSMDSNFNPNPASKVVNEDGTPMVIR